MNDVDTNKQMFADPDLRCLICHNEPPCDEDSAWFLSISHYSPSQ